MSAASPIPPALLPEEYLSPSLSLNQLYHMVWAYRRTIAVVALTLMVLVGLVSKFVLPKAYIATATLQIDAPTRDPQSGAELSAMLAPSYLATQIDLINSTPVLLPAIDALGWTSSSPQAKGFSGPPGDLRLWLSEQVLGRNLKVAAGTKDSRLVSVSYTAPSAEEAANVANTVAKTYIDTLDSQVSAPARERAGIYSQQLEELRKKVEAAQTRLSDFRARTGLVDLEISRTVDIENEQLRDLDTRLLQAEADERNARLRQREDHGNGVGADTEVLNSLVIQNMKTSLLNLEQRFAQVSTTLGPRHPEYRALEAELAAARARLGREMATYSESINQQSAISGATVTQLRQARDAQRQRLLTIRAQQDEGSNLVRELESAELVYKKALESFDQVVFSGARSTPNVALVAPAAPPLKPSKPRALINALVALLGGGLVTLLGCLLWELTHRRVRCAEDLEGLLGEPLLVDFGSAR